MVNDDIVQVESRVPYGMWEIMTHVIKIQALVYKHSHIFKYAWHDMAVRNCREWNTCNSATQKYIMQYSTLSINTLLVHVPRVDNMIQVLDQSQIDQPGPFESDLRNLQTCSRFNSIKWNGMDVMMWCDVFFQSGLYSMSTKVTRSSDNNNFFDTKRMNEGRW